MFLIEGSYGEYDDYTHLPVMIVSDKETAEIVIEELKKEDGDFAEVVKDLFWCCPAIAVSFSYTELPYFSLE